MSEFANMDFKDDLKKSFFENVKADDEKFRRKNGEQVVTTEEPAPEPEEEFVYPEDDDEPTGGDNGKDDTPDSDEATNVDSMSTEAKLSLIKSIIKSAHDNEEEEQFTSFLEKVDTHLSKYEDKESKGDDKDGEQTEETVDMISKITLGGQDKVNKSHADGNQPFSADAKGKNLGDGRKNRGHEDIDLNTKTKHGLTDARAQDKNTKVSGSKITLGQAGSTNKPKPDASQPFSADAKGHTLFPSYKTNRKP